MEKTINTWIQKNKQLIIDLRRWLHQHPELGFEEFKTAEYLKKGSEDIDYCREVISRMSGESYALACEALSRCNLEKSANSITSETLILCGDQDNDLFKDATLWLAQNIPNSQYEWLSPAQHLSPLECKVDFLKIVRKFLEI